MFKFMKSIFGGKSGGKSGEKSGSDSSAVSSDQPDAQQPEGNTRSDTPVTGFTREQIVIDLVAQVCTTMPDPRPFEEIDTRIHMYDAGYVTSITAADLLAHIESRYGVDISETKLIGPLQNIEALAGHIESELS
jgi:acyl carrier protein